MSATRIPRTPRPRKPARKPERTASVSVMTNSKLALWLSEDGEIVNCYTLVALKTDFGIAFRLGKAAREICDVVYDVLVYGNESSCTCPGHTYTNHCKHLSAIEALLAAGKLPCVAVQQDAARAEFPA